MALLNDAELVLGLSRHLSAFQMSSDKAALENLESAGWVLDMAFRLRGSTVNSPERVRAIALDVKLGPRSLKSVIATLESMEWVAVERDTAMNPVSLDETVPVPGTLLAALPKLLGVLQVSPEEYAAVDLLRSTSLRPQLSEEALHSAASAVGVNGSSEAAAAALRHLCSVELVRRVRAEDGREVFYNPHIWTQGDNIANAALRAADARASAEISALIEEVGANPGIPEVHVKSTEARWIKFAVAQGLIQRSTIQTASGAEQGFLFTPHLSRDTFGSNVADPSGQVRQLVGSMVYAATFAQYRLNQPDVFLRALINRGLAGNTSNIGTDYPMLEKAGIVRVVHGYGQDRYRLELLQADVAEQALQLMVGRTSGGTGSADLRTLAGQHSYGHVERERARLALTTDVDKNEEARLLAALREIPSTRSRGPR